MNIRRAATKDAEKIKLIFKHTVINVNVKDYSANQIKAWSDVADQNPWEKVIHNQKVWVAENEKDITGFASLGPDGLFNFLYVHHKYQRQGIATLLQETVEAEARAQKNKIIWACVSVTARPFFLSKGYSITKMETREANGETFENAVMEKVLLPK